MTPLDVFLRRLFRQVGRPRRVRRVRQIDLVLRRRRRRSGSGSGNGTPSKRPWRGWMLDPRPRPRRVRRVKASRRTFMAMGDGHRGRTRSLPRRINRNRNNKDNNGRRRRRLRRRTCYNNLVRCYPPLGYLSYLFFHPSCRSARRIVPSSVANTATSRRIRVTLWRRRRQDHRRHSHSHRRHSCCFQDNLPRTRPVRPSRLELPLRPSVPSLVRRIIHTTRRALTAL
jgi:hypothetical protein